MEWVVWLVLQESHSVVAAGLCLQELNIGDQEVYEYLQVTYLENLLLTGGKFPPFFDMGEVSSPFKSMKNLYCSIKNAFWARPDLTPISFLVVLSQDVQT